MASLRTRTRADGTIGYQVIWYANGRQEYITHDTPASAQKHIDLINRIGPEAALSVVNLRAEADAPPTLAAWCEIHIDALTDVTEGTRSRYRRFIANDLGTLGELPLDAITPEVISKWVNDMKRTGAKTKTIANKHALISAALTRASKRGLVPNNAAHGIKAVKDRRARMEFFTPDEFAVFIGHVRPTERDLVSFLAGTGLRWGEATALQVHDYNARKRTLKVERAWKEAASGVELGPPKSERSNRTIKLSRRAADIIERRVRGKASDDWVFTTPSGVPWRGSGHFHEFVWQPAVAAANGKVYESARTRSRSKDFDPIKGRPWLTPAEPHMRLGKKPNVHSLRHTAASWMIEAGVTLPQVQEYLGHETIMTTVDRYGHLTAASRDQAADALDVGLGAALPEIEA